MKEFADAGITMVGYVHTSYGARDLSDVEADVHTYSTQYSGLAGIFIDECATSSSEVSYYQSLYNYITAISGYDNVIINPGTQPAEGYLDVATSIVIFEDTQSNLKSSDDFASWVTCASSASEKPGYKYKFAGIAYGASSSTLDSTLTTFMNAGMGLVYVTDGTASGDTYGALPSYFTTEVSEIDSLN
jgi:hypothetical protein